MNKINRLFVCEFITGGGLRQHALPENLAREGEMMLNALLKDCVDLKTCEILTTRDPRLPELKQPVQTVVANDDVYRLWRTCMRDADATLIIAPEHDAILFDLVCMAKQDGSKVLGCSSASIRWTTSKIQTAKRLAKHGIAHIKTRWLDDAYLMDSDGGWVVKPDDGVGAKACYFCADSTAVDKLKRTIDTKNFIIQEYIEGIAASLSIVCHQGRAILLACNQQQFKFDHGFGKLHGITVNGLVKYWKQFYTIAKDIAKAEQGLSGYIGVDLIVAATGEAIVVEINPRLTTAYVGLRRSILKNPAPYILSYCQDDKLAEIDPTRVCPIDVLFEGV